MKSICLFFLMFFFAKSVTKAQLIELPRNIARTISNNINDQLSFSEINDSTNFSIREYCFVIRVYVKKVSSDSMRVTNVIQMQEGVVVDHIKDLSFLKSINFAPITHGKKINIINIPCYYSIVNKTKVGSGEINQYYNFWLKFNSMFVSKRLLENELFTVPMTIFGAIYE